jgi:hypothetical protein
MTMAAAAQSYAAQLGMGVIGSVAAATLRFDFRNTTLGLAENFIDANGLRGTRSHVIERNLAGNRPCGGGISLQPTAVEWSNLLQWMTGGTPTGSPTVTYPLSDSVPVRTVVVDRVTKVYTYDTAGIDSWTLSGTEDQALDLDLQVVALDETVGNSGTFPSLSLDTTTFPFKFTDCVIVGNSVTVQPKNFRLTLNNMIDKQRFFNSQTLTGIYARDRVISFECSLPYCDTAALYNVGRAGFTVTITATSGNSILTFSMVAVAFPRNTPTVPERAEIMLPLRGQAFRSGSTLELVTTLNPTP